MYSFTETYETDMKSLTMFQYLMISGRMKQIRWRFFPNEKTTKGKNFLKLMSNDLPKYFKTLSSLYFPYTLKYVITHVYCQRNRFQYFFLEWHLSNY